MGLCRAHFLSDREFYPTPTTAIRWLLNATLDSDCTKTISRWFSYRRSLDAIRFPVDTIVPNRRLRFARLSSRICRRIRISLKRISSNHESREPAQASQTREPE